MKAISIRQPWAWLIVNGHKDVENRTRPTQVRGRVLIHASKQMTQADYSACRLFLAGMQTDWRLPPYGLLREECGGIVGEAEITDSVTRASSPWFTGPHGWVMANAQPARWIRPMRGSLGWFNVEICSHCLQYHGPEDCRCARCGVAIHPTFIVCVSELGKRQAWCPRCADLHKG